MADRPTIDFDDNVQVDLKWKWDGVEPFKTGENSYGKWYLFSVECDGEDCSMFAKQDLMDKLEALSPTLKRGDLVSIKPVKTGKQSRSWHIWVNDQGDGVNYRSVDDQDDQPAKQPPKQPAGQGGISVEDAANVYADCFKFAAALVGVEYPFVEDLPIEYKTLVKETATPMLIACTSDRTILPAADVDDEPPPPSEPPPESNDDDDLPF
jgi:hypothetical protein